MGPARTPPEKLAILDELRLLIKPSTKYRMGDEVRLAGGALVLEGRYVGSRGRSARGFGVRPVAATTVYRCKLLSSGLDQWHPQRALRRPYESVPLSSWATFVEKTGIDPRAPRAPRRKRGERR